LEVLFVIVIDLFQRFFDFTEDDTERFLGCNGVP
jgi:hypothetical protein